MNTIDIQASGREKHSVVELFAAPDCCSGPFTLEFGYQVSLGMNMHTAIVSTYVPGAGFALGADGLRRDQNTWEPVAWNAKKVFLIENPGVGLAYAWAGATVMFGDEPGKPLFNFIEASVEAAALVQDNPEPDFNSFVKTFAGYIYRKLALVGSTKYPPVNSAYPGLIARVLIVGYFNGFPCRAEVEIKHSDNVLEVPVIVALHVGDVPRDFKMFSGSGEMLRRFQPDLVRPESLDEAVAIIRRYIQLCCDNREADQESSGIGGHIHIATATPSGVTWAIPPAADAK